jgi:hypothetical protein
MILWLKQSIYKIDFVVDALTMLYFLIPSSNILTSIFLAKFNYFSLWSVYDIKSDEEEQWIQ